MSDDHPHAVCTSGVLRVARRTQEGRALDPIESTDRWASGMQVATASEIVSSLRTNGAYVLCDGTGVGKTRTMVVAARGWLSLGEDRTVLWVTANQSLLSVAESESASGGVPLERVRYTTYACMTKEHRRDDEQGRCSSSEDQERTRSVDHASKRVLLVADECHLARRGRALRALHRHVFEHDCALLASSATAFVDTDSVVQLGRFVGVWGRGTAWPTERHVRRALSQKDPSVLSCVPLELAQKGMYVSRRLVCGGAPESGNQTVIRTLECSMTVRDEAAYDAVVHALSSITDEQGTKSFTSGSVAQRALLMMCSAIKVRHVLRHVDEYLSQGKSVVLSTCYTGAFAEEGEGPPCLVTETLKGKIPESRRVALHRAIGDTYVNPIDVVTSYYGQDQVVELTGRPFRYLRRESGGRTEGGRGDHAAGEEWVRAPRGRTRDLVRKFCEDECRVAVISRSGGVGLSLHSTVPNGRPRVHVVLDLPWAAEQHVQSLGRCHRVGSASVPERAVAVLDLPTDGRVTTTLTRRMQTLGRLTQGSTCAYDGYGTLDTLLRGGVVGTPAKRRAFHLRLVAMRLRDLSPRAFADGMRFSLSYDPSSLGPSVLETVQDTFPDVDVDRPHRSRSVLSATREVERLVQHTRGRGKGEEKEVGRLVKRAAACLTLLYRDHLVKDHVEWSPDTHSSFDAGTRRTICQVVRCAYHRDASTTLGVLPHSLLMCVVQLVAGSEARDLTTALRLLDRSEEGGEVVPSSSMDDLFATSTTGHLAAETFLNRLMRRSVETQRAVSRVLGSDERRTRPKSTDVSCVLDGGWEWTGTVHREGERKAYVTMRRSARPERRCVVPVIASDLLQAALERTSGGIVTYPSPGGEWRIGVVSS